MNVRLNDSFAAGWEEIISKNLITGSQDLLVMWFSSTVRELQYNSEQMGNAVVPSLAIGRNLLTVVSSFSKVRTFQQGSSISTLRQNCTRFISIFQPLNVNSSGKTIALHAEMYEMPKTYFTQIHDEVASTYDKDSAEYAQVLTFQY
ncbi:MAG: hypothetical protein HYZ34_15175 [Ignavibacteriae bacterium]|nr:hypothetical protein [Ignavibacteriota bacterium]